jgi:hypothetical protein
VQDASFSPAHALFNSRETFLIEYSSYKESGIQADLKKLEEKWVRPQPQSAAKPWSREKEY